MTTVVKSEEMWTLEDEVRFLDEMARGYPVPHGNMERRVGAFGSVTGWMHAYLDALTRRHRGFMGGDLPDNERAILIARVKEIIVRG